MTEDEKINEEIDFYFKAISISKKKDKFILRKESDVCINCHFYKAPICIFVNGFTNDGYHKFFTKDKNHYCTDFKGIINEEVITHHPDTL